MGGVLEGLMILLLLKGLIDKNLFMAGATERAIATTTATNGAAKPSSGETTRPLNKIKKYCTITVTITQ